MYFRNQNSGQLDQSNPAQFNDAAQYPMYQCPDANNCPYLNAYREDADMLRLSPPYYHRPPYHMPYYHPYYHHYYPRPYYPPYFGYTPYPYGYSYPYAVPFLAGLALGSVF